VGLSLYGIFGFFDVVSDGIDLGLSYGLDCWECGDGFMYIVVDLEAKQEFILLTYMWGFPSFSLNLGRLVLLCTFVLCFQ
jgi:hypothetical protein